VNAVRVFRKKHEKTVVIIPNHISKILHVKMFCDGNSCHQACIALGRIYGFIVGGQNGYRDIGKRGQGGTEEGYEPFSGRDEAVARCRHQL
jgi:hypothetical protein